jgi:enoyl-CoA hydratase
MSELVRVEVSNNVATLYMDDGKANAYGPDMIAALSAGLDRAKADANAVVIAGRPGVLCAGFDLRIIRGGDESAAAAMRNAGMELLLKAYLHPQPLVFACTGHALAAGALLLLTGDLRVGTAGEFKIGLNETGIGLALPAFALELARDRLSPKYLSAATINATVYSPEDALEVGYVDAIAAPDEVLNVAQTQAQRLGELSGEAVAATKTRLRQATVDRIRAAHR